MKAVNNEKPKDLLIYENNIEKQKHEIEKKIKSLEIKLTILNNKETILNDIINKINYELNETDPKQFKLIGQIRTTLTRHIESLSLVMDMIFKVEDLIQKYRKMLIDIENQKVNNIFKILKEDEEINEDIAEILTSINSLVAKDPSKNSTSQDNNESPLLIEVEEELRNSGY